MDQDFKVKDEELKDEFGTELESEFEDFDDEEDEEESSGEQRGNLMLEKLEKMFKRPETRVDGQKLLGRVSQSAQAYAKYLVVTGPADMAETAKGCELTEEQLELAMTELETALFPTKKS